MTSRRLQFSLSDSNREALIIRWRTILVLGLHDHFTNKKRFSKIVVREILDMFEGLIKAYAESIGKPIQNKKFKDIFKSILNDNKVSNIVKQKLEEINKSFSSNELNSIRKLFRNPESHYLNLPSIPLESVIRCWRLFSEAVLVCDQHILDYAKNRPEFEDFINIYTFFYKFVISKAYIDLREVKVVEKIVEGRDYRGRIKTFRMDHERTTSEIVEYISNNNW